MRSKKGASDAALLVALIGAPVAVALAAPAAAEVVKTRLHTVQITTVVPGLAHPWSVAFLPDGRKLITERPGRLRVVDANGTLDPTPVAGLPRVDAQGQGGLLDVVLHPDYSSNGWIYWTYTQRDESGANGTELARGKLTGAAGAYRMSEVSTLFRMQPKTSSGLHFGSRLVFDRDGHLYMTLGDRGTMNNAQDRRVHAGSILRLTAEGKPAPGNPFSSDASSLPEIYTFGHRNVQGAALHPTTGALWVSEHGPQGGDELNLIRAGVNYGWPTITYGVNYGIGTRIGEGTEKAGFAQPQKHWIPSPALSGMAFYAADKFAQWRGNVLLGALRGQALLRVRLDGEQVVEDEFMLQGQVPRIRDVRVGPDGFVYLLTDQANGALLRLEPAGG